MTFRPLEQPEEYEHWDLRLPELPPRSTFYQMRPIGVGTPETECLTSYLARLAHAHHLAVGTFLQGYLIPYLKERCADSARRLQGFLLARTAPANGADALAAELVEVIELLTLTTGAQWTTLLCWGETCSRLGLLRHFRAWCANCYTEQDEALYDPLLWMVGVVKVCPRHGRLLTEICRNCHQRLRLVQHRYLPGFCSACGTWLGASRARPAADESDDALQDRHYELWAAEQIGKLIAAAPGLAAPPTRQTVTTAIKSCCDLLMEGNGRSLSHLLGVSNTTGPRWRQGKSVPSLSMLTKLSYLTRLPLLQLLTDPTGVCAHLTSHPIEVGAGQRLSQRPPIRPCSPGFQQIQEQMEAAARESPPPSMNEIARRLGYKHASSLRTKSPELSKQIVTNYRAFKKTRGSRPDEIPRRLNLAGQREILEQALRQPYPESLSALAVQMGYVPSSVQFLARKSPDLCRAVLEKRRQYQQRQREERLHHCRKIVAAALAEDPPPSLEAVSVRAEVESAFLHQYLADDCRRLAERHARLREKQLREVAVRLKQALTEDPPRSIPQLAAELGVGTNRIRGNHPELCRLIVARHKAYRRDCAEKGKRT